MNIDLHCIVFNEAETIHLTLKHYQSFCRQVYIYDNFSTDETREICESMGAIVKPFGIMGQLNDAEYLKVKNHCWKGSDADWVIVCDADEILTIRDEEDFSFMKSLKKDGYSIIKPHGYSMYSNEMPKDSWFDIITGIEDDNYSKLICFRPDMVKEINYIYGCHEAKPEGQIKYFNGIYLFHYKYVGGINRLLKRHRMYKERLSPINKRFNLGHVYSMDEKEQIDNFNINLSNAKEIF